MSVVALLRFTISPEEEGIRVDTFLARVEQIPSRAFAQKLLKNGKVRVASLPVKPSYRLQPGDVIEVELEEAKPLAVAAEDLPLMILYEDGDLIVVNKPRGMVVHPAAGNASGTLVNALLKHCRDLSGIGGVLRPGIVHRLDKDTTGVLVVAKNDFTHLGLAAQLKTRQMSRIYLALVHGALPAEEGEIIAPIGRHPVHRKKMAVVPQGKPAHTTYRMLAAFGPYTLVRVRLQTGRTHQIRVHFHYIGHPVAGDPVYGTGKEPFAIGGQALHAAGIRFVHPRTGQEVKVAAPLPADLEAAIWYCCTRWGLKKNGIILDPFAD
ncbi:MAG: RluA family pseudouridine synthase [Firmicutes bacterium]|nr:RluA family pseudouridine synthase [Bacillota bacterium]